MLFAWARVGQSSCGDENFILRLLTILRLTFQGSSLFRKRASLQQFRISMPIVSRRHTHIYAQTVSQDAERQTFMDRLPFPVPGIALFPYRSSILQANIENEIRTAQGTMNLQICPRLSTGEAV